MTILREVEPKICPFSPGDAIFLNEIDREVNNTPSKRYSGKLRVLTDELGYCYRWEDDAAKLVILVDVVRVQNYTRQNLSSRLGISTQTVPFPNDWLYDIAPSELIEMVDRVWSNDDEKTRHRIVQLVSQLIDSQDYNLREPYTPNEFEFDVMVVVDTRTSKKCYCVWQQPHLVNRIDKEFLNG